MEGRRKEQGRDTESITIPTTEWLCQVLENMDVRTDQARAEEGKGREGKLIKTRDFPCTDPYKTKDANRGREMCSVTSTTPQGSPASHPCSLLLWPALRAHHNSAANRLPQVN
jgi:hypothetical protein